ncbi:2317_t:CDS:2 [Acaulospora colombiana]|uniref:2317_t:CDS:1 n=1 Tax=Acaulospora colombiana TaxID=27376 RepID=A0ACA9NLG1_9GLOM|nr:2317_t:CDS:2 [Acaulospora colombiana]
MVGDQCQNEHAGCGPVCQEEEYAHEPDEEGLPLVQCDETQRKEPYRTQGTEREEIRDGTKHGSSGQHYPNATTRYQGNPRYWRHKDDNLTIRGENDKNESDYPDL